MSTAPNAQSALDTPAPGPSNRSFGLVFAGFFLIVAAWPLLHGDGVRRWALVASAACAVLAFAFPTILTVPNRWWMKFGALLHRIMNPVILGVLFFGVVTPMGALMRLFGKDFLRLRYDRASKSYWIKREPPGPDPKSMPNPF